MSREKFLRELKGELKGLPRLEADRAIQYYYEYFDDAADSGKSDIEIISSLGTPSSVAAQIIADIRDKEERRTRVVEEAKTKPTVKNLSRTIGIALSAPIVWPLMLILYILTFALCITGFALVLSFGIVAVACSIAGVASLVAGVPAGLILGSGFLSLEFVCGGLIALGVGLIFCPLTIGIKKVTVKAGVMVFGNLSRRLHGGKYNA